MVLVFSRRSPGSSTMMPGRPPCAPSCGVQTRPCSLQRVLDDLLRRSLGLRASAHAPHAPPLIAERGGPLRRAVPRPPAPVAGAVVGDGAAVAGQQRVDGVRPRERRRVLDGRAAHASSGPRSQQRADRLRPVVDVVAVDQRAGDTVAHRDRQPADGGGHHRGAAGLRLDGDQAERLRIARHRDQVGGPVHVDELIAGLRRQERHPVGDTQFVGQPNQPVGRGQPAARRSAGHQHPHPRQLGRRAQQHVGRLERLDAADEREHLLVAGRARARREPPRLSPGVNISRSTPGCTTSMRAGSAWCSETSCCASCSVLTINRSASSTTCCSPTARSGGSGESPSASAAFFTAASVCAVCTSGTAQRSRASQPTCPDSQ